MTVQDNVNALSARMLVTDLTLRAILLKINSEKAHESMKYQVLDQLRDIKELWCGKKVQSEGLNNFIFNEVLEKDIKKEFSDIEKYGKDLVEALFSIPKDPEFEID